MTVAASATPMTRPGVTHWGSCHYIKCSVLKGPFNLVTVAASGAPLTRPGLTHRGHYI